MRKLLGLFIACALLPASLLALPQMLLLGVGGNSGVSIIAKPTISMTFISYAMAGNPASSRFAVPMGATAVALSEANGEIPIPIGFTATGLNVQASADPTAGGSWTITVNKDRVATALSCSLTSGVLSCADTDAGVSFSACGSRMSISVARTSTPAAANITVTVTGTSTTNNQTYIGGNAGAILSATATQYVPPVGGVLGSSLAVSNSVVIPATGLLSFCTYLETATGAALTRTFTPLINGQPVSGAATAYTNTTGYATGATTMPVYAGDWLSVESTVSALAVQSSFSHSFAVTPNDGNSFWIPESTAGSLSNSAVRYLPISAGNVAANATETSVQTSAPTETLTILGGIFSASGPAAPTTNKNYTWDIMLNASPVGGGFTQTVTGPQYGGTLTGGTLSPAAGDLLTSRLTPSGTPNAISPSVTLIARSGTAGTGGSVNANQASFLIDPQGADGAALTKAILDTMTTANAPNVIGSATTWTATAVTDLTISATDLGAFPASKYVRNVLVNGATGTKSLALDHNHITPQTITRALPPTPKASAAFMFRTDITGTGAAIDIMVIGGVTTGGVTCTAQYSDNNGGSSGVGFRPHAISPNAGAPVVAITGTLSINTTYIVLMVWDPTAQLCTVSTYDSSGVQVGVSRSGALDAGASATTLTITNDTQLGAAVPFTTLIGNIFYDSTGTMTIP